MGPFNQTLVSVVEGGDDEQCESYGGDEGEADEGIEERQAGAWGWFVAVCRARWRLLRVEWGWLIDGIGHVAPC